jgi:signal transduction histidine kinase
VNERTLADVLVARLTRVTWGVLALYAVVVIVAFAGLSELALGRAVAQSADVIESLLGLYADPEGERTTVAPAMLADQLTGVDNRFVITRTMPGSGGRPRVYYLTPDMPAKEIETLAPLASRDAVRGEVLRAMSGRRWQHRVLQRSAGEFDLLVAASRGPYALGVAGVAIAAALLLPMAVAVSRRRGREAVRAALDPVERVRTATATIGPTSLDRRIPVPTGVAEVTQIADAINRLVERVERSQAQLIAFTADASHELRTPLTHLRAQAQWALDGERSADETRDALVAIMLETDRMHRMVEGLLLLARGDNEDLGARREPFRPALVAAEVAEVADGMAAGRSVDVGLDAADDVVAIGDADHTRQILLNLVSNAIRHTPSGRVTIGVRAENGRVRLTVSDTGIGIGPEHLQRVFDRFYRVETSRSREHGGAGLGLAIARMLAEVQGGTLSCASREGQGSEFWLDLPATVSPPGGA